MNQICVVSSRENGDNPTGRFPGRFVVMT